MIAHRIDGWERRLNAALAAAGRRPFKWGEHDCALFAASAVAQLIGVDLAAPWRGYTTEFGALKRVRKAGGMAALVTSVLGTSAEPALAQRGDVVLIDSGFTRWDGALGVCVGWNAAFAALEGGLAFVPMSLCRSTWLVR